MRAVVMRDGSLVVDDVVVPDLQPGQVLAEVLAPLPPLADREAFRAAAAQVKERTGQKGRALFHPIRVALTGAAEGPELDVIVPAIDTAARLPADSGLAPVTSCRERAGLIASRVS